LLRVRGVIEDEDEGAESEEAMRLSTGAQARSTRCCGAGRRARARRQGAGRVIESHVERDRGLCGAPPSGRRRRSDRAGRASRPSSAKLLERARRAFGGALCPGGRAAGRQGRRARGARPARRPHRPGAQPAAEARPDNPVGRKFDFLCQEFNREANTLCSKSADIELTRIGIDLKGAVERMREQVQNVE
jgi:hypothetical protein